MTSTFETSAAKDVISRAINIWGKDIAQSILSRVIESVDFANTHVKPPYPVNCLRIQIADLPELHPSGVPAPRLGGLHDKWRGFCLLMDEKAPAEVLDEIEEVVAFETSRVRIFQERVLRKFYADNNELSEIDTCVEDGMVVNIVEDILEPQHRPRLREYQSYATEPHLIRQGIEKRLAMGTRPSEGSVPINDLRFGSPEFTRPGYKIGHAIVRSAMTKYEMSFDEMVIQPPSFFSNHAKTMVR